MTHARTAHVPFDFVAAEVAAAPLGELALPLGVTRLHPGLGEQTGELWRAVEVDLLRRFRGFSVDEVVAYRDAVWFPGARDPRPDEDRGAVVPLDKYLFRLARQLLTVEGGSFRPRIPRWGYPSPDRTGGAGPDARAARRTWRWATFSLPPDLLAATLPGPLPGGAEINWLSPAVDRWLRDEQFAEVHCHLGATPDFQSLWVWALRALAERTARADMLGSPGAEANDGRALAAWILRSAIARLLLADFLRLRRLRAAGLTFDSYLEGGPEAADSLLVRSGEQAVLRLATRSLLAGAAFTRGGGTAHPGGSGGPMGGDDYPALASAYRALALQASDTFLETWRAWVERGPAADPVWPLLPAEVDGLEGSAEMRWIRAGLHYMAGGPQGLESGADPALRPRDPLFARAFWQAVRARVALYRHLIQRPLTPGLQWFVRTFARIWPARRNVAKAALSRLAIPRAGGGRGLLSFEVRIGPEDRLDELRAAVDAIWQGCGGERGDGIARRRLSRANPNVFKAPRTGPGRQGTRAGDCRTPRIPSGCQALAAPECGIVIHFVKRRGGGMDQGRPRAHRLGTESDPRRARDDGQCRFGIYYQQQARQARIIAEMFRRWPAMLHFVRGLDVCTDEVAIPTWVIAPLYEIVRRAAREAAIELARRGCEPPPLRATAHAGEDFVHLLSGLRRIDEALVHLTNREGDRIGHAVALGVAAERWAERTRHVMMTREERLLDLVWEWQFYDQGWAEPPGDRGRHIEEEVRRLAAAIFEPWQHLAVREVRELFGGLHDRHELFDECGFPGDRWTPRAPPTPEENPMRGHRLRYLWDPGLFDRCAVLVGVDVAGEARALEILQSALRRRVAQQGVAVEINPTSNLLIGDLSDLANHPMWRLRPPAGAPEGPPIDVCIGSDDPLTFATTLRDEYQLVLDTLEQSRVATHDARAWLDDARKAGLVYRFTVPTWTRDPFEEGFVTRG